MADNERTLVAKLSTVLWAIILFAVAAYSLKVGGKGHVVETGLSIASVAYGALLGVFLLGTLTRYATQTGAILGMITGFAFNLILWLFPGHVLYTGDITSGRLNADGSFTMYAPATLAVPHVAFTWYVFLGALVTFAVGSLASLLFRKQSLTRHKSSVAVLLAFCIVSVVPDGGLSASAQKKKRPAHSTTTPAKTTPPEQPKSSYNFAAIDTLLDEAIAAKKLPGAVVVVGHDSKIVFEQAYGSRKLAGEPGPEGNPSPAEPMTEDTNFDMASLTKCLVTATAIMQLYEEGKLGLDDPIQKYFPSFNPLVSGKSDPERSRVTIRMLLTHYSGESEDVSLKDSWGLAAPDQAEGIKRALAAPLKSAPGQIFRYSDINFILLGHLVETITGDSLNGYAYDHIFRPLDITLTRYHPYANACGPMLKFGAAIAYADFPPKDKAKKKDFRCEGTWLPVTAIPETAPTAHDNEGTAATNPDFDHLLRATVHDPTTRRMGGVAGHAGLFSNADDLAVYAQALLDKLTRNTGPFPLKQATLRMMTTPEQPTTASTDATIFTPDGQPTKGVAARGFGWDINSPFSRPRGTVFPIGSFGHTGFTGTSLWMDPGSNTYVILLANAIHPRGGSPITPLRGQVATAAAQALNLPAPVARLAPARANNFHLASFELQAPQRHTLTGIDVLEQTNYAALKEATTRHQNRLNLAILTNIAGVDSRSRRTIDVIATEATSQIPQLKLTTLFAAEHGLSARQETEAITAEIDPTIHLPITSLYGPKPSDRRPTHAQLASLDAVLIDLQDVGNRFWTFDTVMAYFLEASATEQTQYHHDLEIIVLDHPNPTSGTDFAVQGPTSDPGRRAYVDYTPLPARHGLTIGELALYYNAEATPSAGAAEIFSAGAPSSTPRSSEPKGLHAHLTVVPLQNWRRTQYLDQTGIPWTNPSPNLRSVTAATLYPGIGLFETSNLSVGRGTPTPFEHFGAPYLKPADLLACLQPRKISGIALEATTFPIAETADHYPYHGQTIPGIHLTVTDREKLNSPALAIEIITCVHHLYPTQFNLARTITIIANAQTLAALERGDDPQSIVASWQPALTAFRQRRLPYLLYH